MYIMIYGYSDEKHVHYKTIGYIALMRRIFLFEVELESDILKPLAYACHGSTRAVSLSNGLNQEHNADSCGTNV